jgi:hypothetical protein
MSTHLLIFMVSTLPSLSGCASYHAARPEVFHNALLPAHLDLPR